MDLTPKQIREIRAAAYKVKELTPKGIDPFDILNSFNYKERAQIFDLLCPETRKAYLCKYLPV